jgi:hypothetical protein
MKKEKLLFIPAFSLFWLCAIIIISCTPKEEEKENESVQTPVKVINPVISNMASTLDLNANTVFLKKEVVRAAFAGYIQKTFKNIGDQVNEGEVLFQLQTKESYVLNNPAAQNEKSFVSLKAKSNGILTQLNYHQGDYISEGEQVAVISNPNSLVVMVNVPYQNYSEVRIGSSCKLFLPDGKTLNGKISRSMPSMDVASQTQSFLIECGGISNLPENLNLRVQIDYKSVANALVLPKTCVLSDETLNEFWIMKLINDSTAVKVGIKKGIENKTLVQILTPKLNIEERIISEGGYSLADTAKVIIER